MSRGLFVGSTNYSHQTIEDILHDLEDWVFNLNETISLLQSYQISLEELDYWDKKVVVDLKSLFAYALKFFDTSCKEITNIIQGIREEVQLHHVTRLQSLSQTAKNLNDRFGKIWHSENIIHEYSEREFNILNLMYGEGRSMAADMIDLSNAAGRLSDFIGKKNTIYADSAHMHFIYNKSLEIEETRNYEFKDISMSKRPADSIKETADEYAVAFLNSEGGHLFWGVRDLDSVIVGVNLTVEERDKIRREVGNKLADIRPNLDPTRYRLDIHPIYGEDNKKISDLWVVELSVPQIRTNEPYYTGSDECYVRIDGVKKKLAGTALTDWIKRRTIN